MWVHLSSVLSSSLSYLKPHLTTRPTWFSDFPSPPQPRLVFRPSCMIFNMDPHHPHHCTHPDSWLLPFAELTLNHNTKHVWATPRMAAIGGVLQMCDFKGTSPTEHDLLLHIRDTALSWLSYPPFFLHLKVDSKLNSDLWPRSFKRNRNTFTI